MPRPHPQRPVLESEADSAAVIATRAAIVDALLFRLRSPIQSVSCAESVTGLYTVELIPSQCRRGFEGGRALDQLFYDMCGGHSSITFYGPEYCDGAPAEFIFGDGICFGERWKEDEEYFARCRARKAPRTARSHCGCRTGIRRDLMPTREFILKIAMLAGDERAHPMMRQVPFDKLAAFQETHPHLFVLPGAADELEDSPSIRWRGARWRVGGAVRAIIERRGD
jgi:hypothetical protein